MEVGEGLKKILEKAPHSKLYQVREGASQEEQNLLAPYEHRAFAREVVQENPLMALPVAAAIPIYAAGKATGIIKARSEPSLEEVKQGFIGLGEGLMKLLGMGKEE